MKPEIEQLAAEMGKLLANSPLDANLKKEILDHLDKLPEDVVFKLRDILKEQDAKLDDLTARIEASMKEQDTQWNQIAEAQKKAASDMADQLFDKLKDKL